MIRTRRPLALVTIALALAAALTGCTENVSNLTGASQGADGSTGMNGAIQEYRTPEAPVTFSGTTVTGDMFRSSDYRGRVLVVNFWYAGCPPCRAEAPTLRQLSGRFAKQGVQFVGVNVRDQAPTAAAFEREFSISYPSILDADTGAVQLAFSQNIQANAVPTTLVLDRQGRVRARILGGIPAPSILSTLISDAVAAKT
jgi:thiol-disulfide isomerase/thioredoxin